MARIIDRRTGKRCNYKAVAEEVGKTARREGISWRKAAEAVSELVDEQRAESVVRNLNRYQEHPGVETPASSAEARPLPGLSTLYRNIEERLKSINEELKNSYPQSDEFYGIHAERLRRIREFLETLCELTTSQKDLALPVLASLVSALGDQDFGFEPSILYEGELELVKMLIARTKRLQNEVEIHRPNPTTWKSF